VCDNLGKKIDSVEVAMSNKFASLTDQLNDLSSKLRYGMQQLNVQPSDQESTCQTTLSAESITSMTASILSEEEKLKEKCKLNLIMHNYPEPSSTDPLARKKKDIENISKLLNEYVKVPAMITNAICIGKQLDGPRFTKVIVSSVQEKPFIFRNRYNSCKKLYPT